MQVRPHQPGVVFAGQPNKTISFADRQALKKTLTEKLSQAGQQKFGVHVNREGFIWVFSYDNQVAELEKAVKQVSDDPSKPQMTYQNYPIEVKAGDERHAQ